MNVNLLRLPVAALAVLFLCAGPNSRGRAFDTRDVPVSPSGTRAVVDLPASQHMKNTGGSDGPRGPGSGSGLCVFTSIEHASRWQNVDAITGFQKWMTYREGGGYPSKVDAMLKGFCASKNLPVPPYLQHEGGDVEFLELALKTDRMPCVTYDGRDGFYRGSIGHMVNLAHLDSSLAAIIDNNRPGQWVWMTRSEFLSRWKGNGGGWAVVLLSDPPPPYPSDPKNESAGGVEASRVADAACRRTCSCGAGERCDGPACHCDTGSGEPASPGSPKVFGQCPGGRCPVPAYPAYPTPYLSPLPHSGPPQAVASVAPAVVIDGWVPTTPAADGSPRWLYGLSGRIAGRLDFAGWHPSATNGEYYVAAAMLPPGLSRPDAVADTPSPVEATGTVPDGIPADGVVPNHVGKAQRYRVKDREVSKREAFEALTTNLVDDSSHWHLTAVGDAAFLRQVKNDVFALPADLQAKLLVQAYSPNDWPVSQFALPAGLSLRKPSPVRVGSDVGQVVATEYTAAKLLALLQSPGGPLPPVVPQPMPGPDPVTPVTPTPTPVTPAKPNDPATPSVPGLTSNWLLALLALGGFWLIRRKTAPTT